MGMHSEWNENNTQHRERWEEWEWPDVRNVQTCKWSWRREGLVCSCATATVASYLTVVAGRWWGSAMHSSRSHSTALGRHPCVHTCASKLSMRTWRQSTHRSTNLDASMNMNTNWYIGGQTTQWRQIGTSRPPLQRNITPLGISGEIDDPSPPPFKLYQYPKWVIIWNKVYF